MYIKIIDVQGCWFSLIIAPVIRHPRHFLLILNRQWRLSFGIIQYDIHIRRTTKIKRNNCQWQFKSMKLDLNRRVLRLNESSNRLEQLNNFHTYIGIVFARKTCGNNVRESNAFVFSSFNFSLIFFICSSSTFNRRSFSSWIAIS